MTAKILITGAAGFIGSNAVSRFVSSGWRVLAVDDLSRAGTEQNLNWLTSAYSGLMVEVGDVSDDQIISNLVKKMRPDVILHLAAQVAVTTSISDPKRDFQVNASATLSLLDAVRLFSPDTRVIFASTNKVYGDLGSLNFELQDNRYASNDLPDISEDHSLDFYSPYGCSKGAADQYTSDYSRIFGLNTTVLRQSCIYGRRQFGVEDQGWVAWFALQALRGKPIKIFGSGHQVRDLLYVDDLIDLYFEIASRPEVGPGVFNVGGGLDNSMSLLEVTEYLEGQGYEFDLLFEPERPGDQKYFVSNNRKLREVYGWSPSVGTDEGLPKLLDWLRSGVIGQGH